MRKLTDEEKQKIIADYVMTQNKSETARINNVSHTTVRRIIEQSDNAAVFKKIQEKKEQSTQGVLNYVESRTEEVKTIIGKYVDALSDDDKIAGANLTQIATALGIVMDKFAPQLNDSDGDTSIKVTLDWKR